MMKSLRDAIDRLARARRGMADAVAMSASAKPAWPENWPKTREPGTGHDHLIDADYGAGPVGEDAWARTASEYPWSTAADAAHVRFATALAEFCAAIGIEGTLDNASVDQARDALRRMVAE